MTRIQAEHQTRGISTELNASTPRRRRLGRSVGAVAAGFLAVVVLSLGTDEVLHLLRVYPPWGEPMPQPSLNLLALAYRSIFTVAGMYLTAKLAPHAPMRHALIGGAIGTVIATAGAVATVPMNLGPAWYPIALAVTALPLAWLGGTLYRARNAPAR
jgi:hypothetical protein